MSDEVVEGAAELRNEMMTVNSGSKREGELQQQLTTLYQQKYPSSSSGAPAGPTPRPDAFELAPDDAAIAVTNDRALRLEQLEGELEMMFLLGPRRAALEAERDAILKADYEALQTYAPEPPPTPTTFTFAEGTEEPVKNAFCALALEHDVPRSEAQGVLDSMKGARWLTPEQFRTEMAAEWGDQYSALAALADRTLEQLPFRLRDAVLAREANDSRFSPEVARALIAWAKRRRGGR